MKKKVMLIVPMLHQGGFERVCVATARLLEPFYEVYIVIFSARDIAYDIRGLHVIDLHMGAAEGKLLKIRNVFRRSRRVSALKKDRSGNRYCIQLRPHSQSGKCVFQIPWKDLVRCP